MGRGEKKKYALGAERARRIKNGRRRYEFAFLVERGPERCKRGKQGRGYCNYYCCLKENRGGGSQVVGS